MKISNRIGQLALCCLDGFLFLMDTLWPLDNPQTTLNNQLFDAVLNRDYKRADALVKAGASPDKGSRNGQNCFDLAAGDRQMENILLNKLDNGHAHRAAA